VISIAFGDRLESDTRYRVTVAGVTSPYLDVASDLDAEFTTAPAEFVYLDRADPVADPDGQDVIVRASATDSERRDLVRATRIQDFVVFDELVAVVTLEGDDSVVTLVDPDDGATQRLQLPGPGRVDLVQGSSASNRLGFTFTSAAVDGAEPEYLETLFTVDLTGDQTVDPVLGFDGEPVEVLAWQILPGTADAVIQTVDQSVLRFDLTCARPPQPLGQYAELGRAALDGRSVSVASIAGLFAQPLDGAEATPLPQRPIGGIVPFGGDVQLTGRGVERVQQVAVFDETTGRFSSHVVYDDGRAARILYEKTDQVGGIETFTLSPNGQYATVTTVPDIAASVIDGYPANPASTSVITVIIDVATGDTIGSVDGFDVRW